MIRILPDKEVESLINVCEEEAKNKDVAKSSKK